MKKNYDLIKNYGEDELIVFLESFKDKLITKFVDLAEWLEAPLGTDMFDCCGKPGVFYDRDAEIVCRIIGSMPRFNENYVRIIIRRDGKDDCQVLSVPAHRVRELEA